MDTISQLQLSYLEHGGNRNLLDFLRHYDLVDNDNSQDQNHNMAVLRYFSKAVEFYRLKLKENCEKILKSQQQGSKIVGGGFAKINILEMSDKPNYEEGRVC
jgi:hypothetical protein